jgi:hypothetical protein
MTRFLTLALVALMLPAAALAEEPAPLVGDRPDFTESANTISPGRVQIEAGFTRFEVEESSLTTIGEVLLRVGVAKNTEARLTLGSWAFLKNPPFTDNDGLTDLALGFKHRFAPNDGLVPETALLGTVTLPTGKEGVSFEEVQPILVGAFGWDLGSIFALGVNLGWSHAYSVTFSDRFHTWWGSASLGASLSSRLGAFVEAYGFNREEKDGDANGYGDVGLTYLLGPDLQLDLRTGRGFNGVDNEWSWGFGVVARI